MYLRLRTRVIQVQNRNFEKIAIEHRLNAFLQDASLIFLLSGNENRNSSSFTVFYIFIKKAAEIFIFLQLMAYTFS